MILLVEDSKVSREAYAKILRLHGHEVVEAANATEALDILSSHSCNLVITDFVMPDMSGFQLIAQIRQRWPGMPMLLQSGYLSPEVKDLVSDGVEFIPKPIDMPLLLDTIERLAPKSQPTKD
jgi:DNA-binding NtrC family response regulator